MNPPTMEAMLRWNRRGITTGDIALRIPGTISGVGTDTSHGLTDTDHFVPVATTIPVAAVLVITAAMTTTGITITASTAAMTSTGVHPLRKAKAPRPGEDPVPAQQNPST